MGNITFNTVDPGARAQQIFIELNGVRRSVSGGNLPPIGLIPGQYDQALIAGITDYEPVQVFTAEEVGQKAGFGSEAHRQALWVFGILGGFYDNMWWVPIPIPSTPTAASGTIVFATTATSGGTFFFSVGGDLIKVNVATDDTPTEVGDKLVTALTANLNGSVTGVNVTGTVTLTAKTSGVNGNQISLVLNPSGQTQLSQNPGGMTASVPGSGGYLTGGVGATDVNDMFFETDNSDKLGDRFYTCIAGPYNDSTNIGYYDTSWNLRKDPGVKRPFNSFFGYVKETYAQAFAIPDTINSEGVSPVWDPRSYSPNWELQAAVMGLVMWSNVFDPGRPFKTLSTGIPHNSEIGDLSYAKNDALFTEGMGYFKSISGELKIGDLATSYRTSGTGASTEEWFDTLSVSLRQQKIYDIENLFKTTPYDRAILADDDSISAKPYVIKPKKVVSDLCALVNVWDEQGWTKNAAVVKATISAEINSLNNSRIDATITDDEAKALRIVAVLYNFLFD
jgi:phage tail sheath gpL-like